MSSLLFEVACEANEVECLVKVLKCYDLILGRQTVEVFVKAEETIELALNTIQKGNDQGVFEFLSYALSISLRICRLSGNDEIIKRAINIIYQLIDGNDRFLCRKGNDIVEGMAMLIEENGLSEQYALPLSSVMEVMLSEKSGVCREMIIGSELGGLLLKEIEKDGSSKESGRIRLKQVLLSLVDGIAELQGKNEMAIVKKREQEEKLFEMRNEDFGAAEHFEKDVKDKRTIGKSQTPPPSNKVVSKPKRNKGKLSKPKNKKGPSPPVTPPMTPPASPPLASPFTPPMTPPTSSSCSKRHSPPLSPPQKAKKTVPNEKFEWAEEISNADDMKADVAAEIKEETEPEEADDPANEGRMVTILHIKLLLKCVECSDKELEGRALQTLHRILCGSAVVGLFDEEKRNDDVECGMEEDKRADEEGKGKKCAFSKYRKKTIEELQKEKKRLLQIFVEANGFSAVRAFIEKDTEIKESENMKEKNEKTEMEYSEMKDAYSTKEKLDERKITNEKDTQPSFSSSSLSSSFSSSSSVFSLFPSSPSSSSAAAASSSHSLFSLSSSSIDSQPLPSSSQVQSTVSPPVSPSLPFPPLLPSEFKSSCSFSETSLSSLSASMSFGLCADSFLLSPLEMCNEILFSALEWIKQKDEGSYVLEQFNKMLKRNENRSFEERMVGVVEKAVLAQETAQQNEDEPVWIGGFIEALKEMNVKEDACVMTNCLLLVKNLVQLLKKRNADECGAKQHLLQSDSSSSASAAADNLILQNSQQTSVKINERSNIPVIILLETPSNASSSSQLQMSSASSTYHPLSGEKRLSCFMKLLNEYGFLNLCKNCCDDILSGKPIVRPAKDNQKDQSCLPSSDMDGADIMPNSLENESSNMVGVSEMKLIIEVADVLKELLQFDGKQMANMEQVGLTKAIFDLFDELKNELKGNQEDAKDEERDEKVNCSEKEEQKVKSERNENLKCTKKSIQRKAFSVMLSLIGEMMKIDAKQVSHFSVENEVKAISSELAKENINDDVMLCSFGVINAMLKSSNRSEVGKEVVQKRGLHMFIEWVGVKKENEISSLEGRLFDEIMKGTIALLKKEKSNNANKKVRRLFLLRSVKGITTKTCCVLIDIAKNMSEEIGAGNVAEQRKVVGLVIAVARAVPSEKAKCDSVVIDILDWLQKAHVDGFNIIFKQFLNSIPGLREIVVAEPYLGKIMTWLKGGITENISACYENINAISAMINVAADDRDLIDYLVVPSFLSKLKLFSFSAISKMALLSSARKKVLIDSVCHILREILYDGLFYRYRTIKNDNVEMLFDIGFFEEDIKSHDCVCAEMLCTDCNVLCERSESVIYSWISNCISANEKGDMELFVLNVAAFACMMDKVLIDEKKEHRNYQKIDHCFSHVHSFGFATEPLFSFLQSFDPATQPHTVTRSYFFLLQGLLKFVERNKELCAFMSQHLVKLYPLRMKLNNELCNMYSMLCFQFLMSRGFNTATEATVALLNEGMLLPTVIRNYSWYSCASHLLFSNILPCCERHLVRDEYLVPPHFIELVVNVMMDSASNVLAYNAYVELAGAMGKLEYHLTILKNGEEVGLNDALVAFKGCEFLLGNLVDRHNSLIFHSELYTKHFVEFPRIRLYIEKKQWFYI
ncbi:uncharacterized protein MONOS_10690 [Monocercomonoides exilis]|uniref:uncharacterized protein n=1 Tax=Monocercomonoides exilis TaxID=2049356 RepID=UPI00355A928A|nr:hypothetical protein MONOS_10690 [Monocercomonoides exilis]|eukprot:MONOS_10690.1-p1 / transcript=MONOS_10690.1 / gene=MONOS_10690 / organism=Monocercomonoides_exilis_PA203 / gene_product=unspecified product / transcript_product=unspecified product / location=Mono_scaffold00495:33443-38877(+) / protein_length=1627 / sequence_SO=supercontig / SO=protein_coding / is_pseudo=false